MVSIYSSYVWKGEPIIVKGRMDRFRNFLYVEDTVDALVKSLREAKTLNNTYLLSTGEKVTVKDLISKIITVSGNDNNYPVIQSDGTPGDTFGFHANIEKISTDLNWKPKYTLERGIRKYFEWIKKVPIKDNLSKFHPFDMS